ncbi:MAG: hypothetical protein KDA87_13105 [Planctomycetales bacterium]|nr:hypothetical protein [Planctomycetales bacterium]
MGDSAHQASEFDANALNSLLDGRRSAIRWNAPQNRSTKLAADVGRRAIFSGSFNPRHQGHRDMAFIAASVYQLTVEHEISIQNVDKASLTAEQIAFRLTQFQSNEPVWLTNLARFTQKAAHFSSCTFLIGMDTFHRLLDPGYHRGQHSELRKAIRLIQQHACDFLVFSRSTEHKCAQVRLDELGSHCDIFRFVPPELFHLDISSTQLRRSCDLDQRNS